MRTGLARALMAACCLLLAACSAATRYEWLCFFFDGVPDPNRAVEVELLGPPAPRRPWAEILAAGNTRAQLQQHAPYADRACAECHVDRPEGRRGILSIEQMAALRMPPDKVCAGCHELPPERFVHAPANVGLCTFCHHPHQSLHPALLREPTSEDLCTACHAADTWPTRDQHADYGDRDCSACHDPHASDDPMLLRPGWQDLDPVPIVPFGPPAPTTNRLARR